MNNIRLFLHCAECVKALPNGESISDWARLEVGLKTDGNIEVWCTRHDRLVCNVPTDQNYKDKMMHVNCGHEGCNGVH